jgi:uncharacterized protein YndB with AHSA1/START domain
MPANNYQFMTEWKIDAPREVLYEILRDGKDYPQWWPAVYLEAHHTPSGRADKLGDRVRFLTRGRLPYRLSWTAEVVRFEPPELIEIKATGDFDGRGIWRLASGKESTLITFDWRLRADKPLLKWLSPVLKPVFRWNHKWAMDRGIESLIKEVRRRQRLSN